jgi:hypothetical protein
MTSDEILRRLRALRKHPKNRRPISLYMVAKLTGIDKSHLYALIPNRKRLTESTRIRLERAFLLIENNQVSVKKFFHGSGKPYEYTIKGEAKPVQKMAKRVRMTPKGPVIEFVPVNPMALPELPKINEKW